MGLRNEYQFRSKCGLQIQVALFLRLLFFLSFQALTKHHGSIIKFAHTLPCISFNGIEISFALVTCLAVLPLLGEVRS